MIYVASSWRNKYQPEVVAALRDAGCEVYDFRNPKDGDNGFSWRQLNPHWLNWTPMQWRDALKHPVAVAGFKSDMDALKACDTCLLVLPCGRSAHLELGYAVGAGKRSAVLCLEATEPDLMVAMCDHLFCSLVPAVDWCAALNPTTPEARK